MNFLAPLFTLGALALIGPILFHLIRRSSREITPFSTLMFLKATPPRVTQRSRLENLWLLLLRCLVLLLLALGFARPFFPQKANLALAPGSGKRVVILIDTSASMRRKPLWKEACAKAQALLAEARPADQVCLLTFDRTVQTLIGFEEWNRTAPAQRVDIARERLSTTAPGWNATMFDSALIASAERLQEPIKPLPAELEIALISDFQEGAHIDSLAGYHWPKNLSVTLHAVSPGTLDNAGLSWLPPTEVAASGTEAAPIRLRVFNSPQSKHEQFQVRWGGLGTGEPGANAAKSAGAVDAVVPAGQNRIVNVLTNGASSLVLSGDENEFDNTVYVLPAQAERVPILFFGPDAESDSQAALYYLRRAFPKTTSRQVEITAIGNGPQVTALQLKEAQLIIVGDGVPSESLKSIRAWAGDGKIVLAPLSSIASATTISRLFEVPFSASEAPIKDYALLSEIDFAHPLFAGFADPRYSDFTKIHFWKARHFDAKSLPGMRVLARFDGGDPAVVQVPLGKGSVVILASSWNPADSQLALSSKFVPLLHALLDQNLPIEKAQFQLGDSVPLQSGALSVRKPDGSIVNVSGNQFSGTDQPGFYAVAPGQQRFVVNLAPEESRTAPLPVSRFKALGLPIADENAPTPETRAQNESRAQALEAESQQKLWRWLIMIALLALLVESFITGKIGSRTRIPAVKS